MVETARGRQERHGGRNRKLAAHTVPTLRKQSMNRKWGWTIKPQIPMLLPSLHPIIHSLQIRGSDLPKKHQQLRTQCSDIGASHI